MCDNAMKVLDYSDNFEIRYSNNYRVEHEESKEIDVLFTTKCSRGVDFPGEQCNSIILTRYPYPDVNSLFWKILQKEKPLQYMKFYMDKAKREFQDTFY